jgi:hypothetical protein
MAEDPKKRRREGVEYLEKQQNNQVAQTQIAQTQTAQTIVAKDVVAQTAAQKNNVAQTLIAKDVVAQTPAQKNNVAVTQMAQTIVAQDIVSRNRDAITAKRLSRVDAMTTPSLKPLPTWDAGYDSSGRRLVQTLGQDPVAVGRPVSTGAIGAGDRTYNTGSAVDVIPHIKPGPVVLVKKEESGNVKILFSVIQGSEKVFYVGGDRRTPKELFRVPSSRSDFPHLVATGKGLNAFYWQNNLFDSRFNAVYADSDIGSRSYVYFGSGVFISSVDTAIRNESTDTGGFRSYGFTRRVDFRTNDLDSRSCIDAGTKFYTIDASRVLTPWPSPVPLVYPATGTTTDVDSETKSGFYSAGNFRFLADGSKSGTRYNTFTQYNTTEPDGSATPNTATWSANIAENSRDESPLYIGADSVIKTVHISDYTSSGSAVLNQNPIIYGEHHGRRLSYQTKDYEILLSPALQELIENKLQSYRHVSISGSTFWVLGDSLNSTNTQLLSGQSFINLLGIELLSGSTTPKKVKIFPLPNTAIAIHSVYYTP